MFNRTFGMAVWVICLGILLGGCPKKTVMRDDSSLRKAEDIAAAERERIDRLQHERKEMEARELAKIKEEETRKALAEKELEAERERAAKLAAERTVRENELKWREEEARKALAERELEAERERAAKLAAERTVRDNELKWREEEARKVHSEEEMEFDKTLVAKKYPGIEGEVFESAQLQDVYFDYNMYDFGSRDVENLQKIAALLMRHLTLKIQIEGHCDERGTQEYNLALGERRANSVKQYLISFGIAHDRISTISYGEEKPADPGYSEEAYSKNRRAHFVILSR